MEIIEQIYQDLVNRNPDISIRYHRYRDQVHGVSRVKAWGYLIKMNIEYRLLKQKVSAGEDLFYKEKQLRVKESESSVAFRETPEELAERLAKYDVISFDVFDTLIFRPVSQPSDLFFFVGEELKYLDFCRIRMEMEQRARKEKYEKYGVREVTFEEIWSMMESETGITKERGMQIEWEIEKKYCFANPYMKRVVEKLRSLGKTLIITSDMYLGKDEIKKLLAHCGYGTFAHYFISCEYGKSKHDGSIYQEIKNSCKNSEKIIHIGDNKVSDKKQAEKNGIEAVWYPNVNEAGAVYRSEDMSKVGGSIYRGLVNSWLYNGMKAYSMPYEYGFIYGGIFVLGYCQWIHQYVKEHEIEKILFLSRDGDILSKVYETLYPEEIGKWNYVYWSRIAATKMTAAYFKYDYFRRFLYHKVNQGYSLKAIFQSMELEDLLYDFLQESRHKGKTENSVLDEKTAEEVKQFLQENWKDVLAHYQTQIQMGKQYFGEILRECASVAVVDIGWAGSGAVSLDYLINEVWGMQCNVTGLVAGTNTIFNQEPDASESFLYSGKLVSYAFSQQENRDIWKKHNPNRGDNLAAEMLLASPTYSFRRFNEDGTLKFAEHEIEIDAKEVQDGIIDFVKWYLMRMQKIPKISGRDAYAPLLTVLSNEEYFRNLLRTEKVQMNLE